MTKIKHKQATVKINNTSVVIYYSLVGKQMRYSTGITISGIKDRQGKLVYWDYRLNKLKLPPVHANDKVLIDEMVIRQKTIDDLLKKANDTINEHFTKDVVITPNELKGILSSNTANRINKASATLFDYYNGFLEYKTGHFTNIGNIISLKDYTSTKLLLLDYQAYVKSDIKITDINLHWLQRFVQYMTIAHPKKHDNHIVSTKGEMANSTIKKRLAIMIEFFNYLKELKIVTQDDIDVIKKLNKSIKKNQTNKETLDIKEIQELYQYQFKKQPHQLIRDLFVFLCLTGIRYQDLVDFDRKFIQKSKTGEGFVYIKKASKTGIDYNIPLSNIVLEILEKYNYTLPFVSDAYGNKTIKEALKITGKFNDVTQQIDKKTKEYKRRYDVITLHKGRNSFITNLVDVVPLNELMKYTGHKKLSTLQSYIDVKRPVKMNYIKIFDL